MAKVAQPNVWRRGPAMANNDIPVSAQVSVPLLPRGPAIGFFVSPLYQNNSQPGNTSPAVDPPMSAYTATVKKRNKGMKRTL